jgi:hypothetical protein
MSTTAIAYNKTGVKAVQLWQAFMFPLFVLVSLGFDSPYFRQHFFEGRPVTTVLALLYFGFIYKTANPYLRRLILVIVPLTYIGELIFCKLLHMYDYAGVVIPLYVPVGHALVYASGFIFAHTAWAMRNDAVLKKFFKVFFVVVFACSVVLLHDYFTIIFGLLFFVVLHRKRYENLYCFVALSVLFTEVSGVLLGCWNWRATMFGVIPSGNPPMGAVFIYAGGDVLLAKIVDIWQKKQQHKKTKIH